MAQAISYDGACRVESQLQGGLYCRDLLRERTSAGYYELLYVLLRRMIAANDLLGIWVIWYGREAEPPRQGVARQCLETRQLFTIQHSSTQEIYVW